MLSVALRSRRLSDLGALLKSSITINANWSGHQTQQLGSSCCFARWHAALECEQAEQRRQCWSLPTHSVVNHVLHGPAVLAQGRHNYSTQQPRAVSAASQAKKRSFQPISLSSLSPGHRKRRKRRARGGGDKQAGRGYNGQKSRSGTGKPALFFEGGQTPMWKMLPRRGFKNAFKSEYDNVLLAEIEAYIRAGKLDPSRVITVKHMYDAGLLEKKAHNRDGVQILAKSPSRWKSQRLKAMANKEVTPTFSIPVDLEVQRVSGPAREAIEAAGGRVKTTYYNPLGMRAVLLPEWFKKKGRLLPRAVQMVPYKKQWRFDCTGSIPATDAPALEDMPPPHVLDKAPPDGPDGGGGAPLIGAPHVGAASAGAAQMAAAA